MLNPRRETKLRYKDPEKYRESPEYKRARLSDLTGIVNPQELSEIFLELLDMIDELEVEVALPNLIFKNLTTDEMSELELILKKLRIFGFPEPIERSNRSDFVLENRRDLEILRLMNVFRAAETKLTRKQERERIEEETRIRDEERKEAQARAVKYLREKAEREKRELEQQEIVDAIINAQKVFLTKWETDKKAYEEAERVKKEALQKKVEEFLQAIPKQEVSDEEIEIALRESPLDDLYGFGKLQNIRRAKSKLREKKVVKKEEEDVEDVDVSMRQYSEDFLLGRLPQIDTPEEQKIWNAYLPSLKIFEPRQYLWQKIGKSKPVLLEAETGRKIPENEREMLFIAAKDFRTNKKSLEVLGKVIQMNLNLIIWLIKDLKYFSPAKFKNISGDDLLQLGIMGLLAAIERYDPAKAEVSGYHVSFMRNYIEGYMRGYNQQDFDFGDKVVGTNPGIENTKNKLIRMRIKLHQTFPDRAVDEKLVEQKLREEGVSFGKQYYDTKVYVPDLQKNTYEQFLRLIQDTYSEVGLETLDDEIETQIHDVDMLGNYLYHQETQLTEVELAQLAKVMSKVLGMLTPREERVLRMRFGMMKQEVIGTNEYGEEIIRVNPEKTFEEVGNFFGVTRERVRQIELKALRKLKHPAYSRKLRTFFDD